MTQRPFLHERMRREFEIALPPDAVLQQLLDVQQPGLTVSLLEESSDHALLSIVAMRRKQTSYALEVRLRRWQGTDTRVELYGQILTPPPPIRITIAAVVVLTAIAAGVALWIIANLLPLPITDDVNAIIFCFGSLGLLAAVMATGIGSNALLVRDWYANRRWRDQQALAGFATELETRLHAADAETSLTVANESHPLYITNDMDTERYAGDIEA